ncbi:MAG: metallophosphoesterase family protein [bacterium]|nr:metallophosphoesterase family protein [bacterium]
MNKKNTDELNFTVPHISSRKKKAQSVKYAATSRRVVGLLTVLILLFGVNPLGAEEDKINPERIILNLTSNPAEEMAVTWRTAKGVDKALVEYMPATSKSIWSINKNSPNPYKDVKSKKAVSQKVKFGERKKVAHHSVIIDGLEPDSHYQYRVGDGDTWSEWCFFRTAAKSENGRVKPFKFIYMGDPQDLLYSFCPRAFRAAYSAAPDAMFILVTGDLVAAPWKDSEWGGFFYTAGWIARQVPFIMTPGNHEYYKMVGFFTKTADKPNKLWGCHFTLPENGPKGLNETAYYIDYQGVRFITLNGNEKLKKQVKWLEKILQNNTNRWTIIATHQPYYSTGKHRDNPELRELFLPVIYKYNVDLVLQGHDHTYGRTRKLMNGEIVEDSQKGTVFVVSFSGPKCYELSQKHLLLMKKVGGDNQLFQVISVENNVLRFESRTVTNELFDSFELKK